MNALLDHITKVKEDELGVKEFQVAVLSALLDIMKEQESLNKTLKNLSDSRSGNHHLGNMEVVTEDDSTADELTERKGPAQRRGHHKHLRSDHTQTSSNTTILYYHEAKKSSFEETDPNLIEEDNVPNLSPEEEDNSLHRWKKRIPSSKFGEIIKAQGKYSTDLTTRLNGSSQDNPATKYGKDHEHEARRKLETILGVEIKPPKKFIDKDNKYLVTIPDGLIGEDKIVEIKCPFKCSKSSMENLAKSDANFCLEMSPDGRLRLREDHEYYYQVQGELNISKREVCYFVVWSPTEFHYQVIYRDQHFWDVYMFPWLLDFHRKYILDNKWKEPDVGEEEYKKKSAKLWQKLKTDTDGQTLIEKSTRGQGRNNLWMKERRDRLTASNFGRVAKMRSTTSCQNIVKSILYPEKLDHIEGIRYGKDHEKFALAELNRILSDSGQRVEECGLFVDTDKSFLAASPDGLVGTEAVVEVKCPLKCADSRLDWLAARDSSFCLQPDPVTGGLRLKRSHNYHYQVQGQMHVTRRSKCYFMVWSPIGYHLEIIDYDPVFWEGVEQILENFYMNCLLPEIIDPRAPRGLPIREPDYIVEEQNLRNLRI